MSLNFGNNNNTIGNQASGVASNSLFGGASYSLFAKLGENQSSDNKTQKLSLFGNTTSQNTNSTLFTGTNEQNKTEKTSLFGNNSVGGVGLLGSFNTSTGLGNKDKTPESLFGGTSIKPEIGGIFGSINNDKKPEIAASSSIFSSGNGVKKPENENISGGIGFNSINTGKTNNLLTGFGDNKPSMFGTDLQTGDKQNNNKTDENKDKTNPFFANNSSSISFGNINSKTEDKDKNSEFKLPNNDSNSGIFGGELKKENEKPSSLFGTGGSLGIYSAPGGLGGSSLFGATTTTSNQANSNLPKKEEKTFPSTSNETKKDEQKSSFNLFGSQNNSKKEDSNPSINLFGKKEENEKADKEPKSTGFNLLSRNEAKPNTETKDKKEDKIVDSIKENENLKENSHIKEKEINENEALIKKLKDEKKLKNLEDNEKDLLCRESVEDVINKWKNDLDKQVENFNLVSLKLKDFEKYFQQNFDSVSLYY